MPPSDQNVGMGIGTLSLGHFICTLECLLDYIHVDTTLNEILG